ncbi:MAG TPA: hypothetical protein VGR62_01230 [Candidatus Binatia bacterium]|nr:hypothetical protein [Candidatus Binatia bacterium]
MLWHTPSFGRYAVTGHRREWLDHRADPAAPTAQDLRVGVAALPDGSFVLYGPTARDIRGEPGGLFLVRYSATGVWDESFGAGGVTMVQFPPTAHPANMDIRVAVQGDGRVVALLLPEDGSSILARFGVDGELDATFGMGGRTYLPPAARGRDLLLQPDGDVLVIGPNSTVERIQGECPALPDADGDGIGDGCDPCTSPAVATAKLTLSGPLLDGIENSKLVFTGKAPASLAGFDPLSKGLLFLLQNPAGGTVQSAWIPAKGFDAAGGAGWSVKGTGYVYKNVARTYGRFDGIAQVSVKGQANGNVAFKVKVAGWRYGVGLDDLPLRATIVFDPPHAGAGRCAVADFPSGCTFTGCCAKAKVVCR